jgi:hypothetical protein
MITGNKKGGKTTYRWDLPLQSYVADRCNQSGEHSTPKRLEDELEPNLDN